MHRPAVTLLVMVGCGRYSFDTLDDAASDTVSSTMAMLEVAPADFATTSSAFVDIPGAALLVPESPGQKWLLLASASLLSTSFDYTAPPAAGLSRR